METTKIGYFDTLQQAQIQSALMRAGHLNGTRGITYAS